MSYQMIKIQILTLYSRQLKEVRIKIYRVNFAGKIQIKCYGKDLVGLRQELHQMPVHVYLHQ